MDKNEQTVGKTTLDVSEERINTAIEEVKKFFEQSVLSTYEVKIKKKLNYGYFDVKIKDIDIEGISFFAGKEIFNKTFDFSRIFWIESKNGSIIFNFRIN